MEFEFDGVKSRSNKFKHDIDFEEAQAVWRGERIEIDAKLGEGAQKRYAVLGKIKGIHHTVIITYRGAVIRIISARRSSENEKQSMSKISKKNSKLLTAAEFDAKADAGEDISGHLDLSTARVFAPGEERLDITIRKVNLDIPQWMIEALDRAANRIGVTRQSIIKTWLADQLARG